MHKGFLVAALGVMACGGAPSANSAGPMPGSSPAPYSREWWCGDPSLQRTHISSAVKTSAAINGSGFFVLKTAKGLRYTRWGEFTQSADGLIVNTRGLVVQGSTADQRLVNLETGPSRVQAQATSTIIVKASLDPNATIMTFDPSEPWSTSNFNTSVRIYDSLGQAYDVTIYYSRTGTGAWDWHAMVNDGAVLTGGTAGAPAEIASGAFTFTTTGALDTCTETTNFNPQNAVSPQPLSFNFGTPINGARSGDGLDGIVQNIGSHQYETTFTGQDGMAAGRVDAALFEPSGRLITAYTNGLRFESEPLALANFANPLGLRFVGEHLFAETIESGPAVYGTAMDDTFGSIRPQALELPCDP